MGRSIRLAAKGNVFAHPPVQMLEIEGSSLHEAGDECIGFVGICREPRAVDDEERVGHRKGGPFVAVDERMVLRRNPPERGRFLDQIAVITWYAAAKGRY